MLLLAWQVGRLLLLVSCQQWAEAFATPAWGAHVALVVVSVGSQACNQIVLFLVLAFRLLYRQVRGSCLQQQEPLIPLLQLLLPALLRLVYYHRQCCLSTDTPALQMALGCP